MNIIFMGTPSFSIPALETIYNSNHTLLAVVTQPDRPKGRGKTVTPSPVKEFAVSKDIVCLQPVKANSDKKFIEALKGYKPDIIVVAAYGQIISQEILNIPSYGCINVHASLLPLYRGAAPINRAIINGDKITGITIMNMDKGMDTGDIISLTPVDILLSDNAITLQESLAKTGAEEALKAIDSIEAGTAQYRRQDDKMATYAPALKKEDGLINWHDSAACIVNKIRGLVPWPCAYTFFKGVMIKIWDAETYDTLQSYKRGEYIRPGEIIIEDRQRMIIAARNGYLKINYLQMQNKRKMSSREFIQGHVIKIGDRLTSARP